MKSQPFTAEAQGTQKKRVRGKPEEIIFFLLVSAFSALLR